MVFDYDVLPPYLTYSVMSADGRMVHHTDIDLPGPRLLHDLAITEHHTIFLDFPLMWDPELLARGKTKVTFRADMPGPVRHPRAPRRRRCDQVVRSRVLLHVPHDQRVGIGRRDRARRLPDREPARRRRRRGRCPHIDVLRLEPYLHEWRFNLVTGAVHERALDDVMTEFPRMNNQRLGRPTRYAYSPRIAEQPTLLFDGFVKYDTDTGSGTAHGYGDGRFGGETVFAPRTGATAEDDGYVLTFVTEAGTGASEAIIVDAQRVEDGPVARVQIPQRVPIGYHAWWVGADELDAQPLTP